MFYFGGGGKYYRDAEREGPCSICSAVAATSNPVRTPLDRHFFLSSDEKISAGLPPVLVGGVAWLQGGKERRGELQGRTTQSCIFARLLRL